MPVLTPHWPNLSPICPIDLLPEPVRSAVLYGIREKDLWTDQSFIDTHRPLCA